MINLFPIEFRHLRYFIAAAEYGSFRKAGAALEIQESSISRRIRDLEDQIGVALFIRHSGGVKLTNAGTKFLLHARTVIGRVEYALKDAGAAGRGEIGVVRIGILSSLASGFLAELLQFYQAENPQIHLEVAEGAPAEHVSAVQHHRMDVAFLPGGPVVHDCEATVLWEERVFVALPGDHALIQREVVHWNDLRDERFIVTEADPGPAIHDYVVRHLAELEHHPNVEQYAVGRDNLLQLVALGRGLTLTNEATIATVFPDVVFRPLGTDKLPFSAIWSSKNDNPAFRRLMSAARSLARQR